MTRWIPILCVAAAAACGEWTPRPAHLSLGEDACAHCRMTILSMKTAAQIVSPGREPVLFDELGCLRDYLGITDLPDDAVVFVADHRTRTWVDARGAVFTRTAEPTPMASGLLAHADAASRDGDPSALGGTALAVDQILISPPGKAAR
jgi:copper chaperone NosL